MNQAEALLKDALPHAEWHDKHIHPYNGETFQTWCLSIYLPVKLSEADKSPEAALARAMGAAGPDDAEIGRQWRENSSLEKWFPITAERLAALEAESAALKREAHTWSKAAEHYAASEARLADALTELVALEDMRLRLRELHEMGHGTDYYDYHRRLPLAWAAARTALGPNVNSTAETAA
jgi:hypothetical protein